MEYEYLLKKIADDYFSDQKKKYQKQELAGVPKEITPEEAEAIILKEYGFKEYPEPLPKEELVRRYAVLKCPQVLEYEGSEDDMRLSPEEVADYQERLRWTHSLSVSQVDLLCDAGYYNDTIRGYLILAAENAGYDRDQIKKLLNGLRLAFSDYDRAAAETYYRKW